MLLIQDRDEARKQVQTLSDALVETQTELVVTVTQAGELTERLQADVSSMRTSATPAGHACPDVRGTPARAWHGSDAYEGASRGNMRT